MKAAESDGHCVLMPSPVRYIGQLSDSRGRRQNLSRHCARNIPYFHIDDRPYDNALTVWQPKLGPIDDRRVFHTFIWQRHPTHHPFGPICTQIPLLPTRNSIKFSTRLLRSLSNVTSRSHILLIRVESLTLKAREAVLKFVCSAI